MPALKLETNIDSKSYGIASSAVPFRAIKKGACYICRIEKIFPPKRDLEVVPFESDLGVDDVVGLLIDAVCQIECIVPGQAVVSAGKNTIFEPID